MRLSYRVTNETEIFMTNSPAPNLSLPVPPMGDIGPTGIIWRLARTRQQ